MNDNSTVRVLAVPNLQGERFTCEIENSQIVWVESSNSLQHQVETLKQEYNGQQLLIGTSFGGLAAWMFSAQQSPSDLRGLILIDVLPTLDAFPDSRALGFAVLNRMPQKLSQYLYNQYRNNQKLDPVPVRDVLLRVRSIKRGFPQPYFPVPTLVVSTNRQFHHDWKQLSKEHDLLSVQEHKDLAIQIAKWLRDINAQ